MAAHRRKQKGNGFPSLKKIDYCTQNQINIGDPTTAASHGNSHTGSDGMRNFRFGELFSHHKGDG